MEDSVEGGPTPEGYEMDPARAAEMGYKEKELRTLADSFREAGMEEDAAKTMAEIPTASEAEGQKYDAIKKAQEDVAARDQAAQTEQKTVAEENVAKAVRSVGIWMGQALRGELPIQKHEHGITVNLKLGRIGREYQARETGEAPILPEDSGQAREAFSKILKFVGVNESELDAELTNADPSHKHRPGKNPSEWHSDKFPQVFMSIPLKDDPRYPPTIYVASHKLTT